MNKLLLGWPQAEEMKLAPGLESHMKIDRVGEASELLRRLGDGYDWIAVHAALFPTTYPWEWLQAIRQSNPAAEVVIALSEKVHGSIYMELISDVAAALGFRLVPAGMAESEALDRLAAIFRGEEAGNDDPADPAGGRVITVISCTPKDGATTIAAHAAIGLAEQTGLRVGLLDLNLKSPGVRSVLDIRKRGKSIADVKPGCLAGTLSVSELLAACCKRPCGEADLHVLLGSPRRDTAGDYESEQLRTLLEAARRAFDIVLADVHSFPDNAATVSAVRSADERWLIAQPHMFGFRSGWSEWYDCVWRYCGLTAGDFSLIVNRAETGNGMAPGALSSSTGISLAATIANVPGGAGIKAANTGALLRSLPGAERFAKDVDGLVRAAAQRHGIAVSRDDASFKPGVIRRIMSSVFSPYRSSWR